MVRVAGDPSLWQDNSLKWSWANLVRGKVKPIGNDSAKQKRPPQVQEFSESDLIICIRIIESEGLLLLSHALGAYW